jgi:L-threonylcarbamoyladenylate synthase
MPQRCWVLLRFDGGLLIMILDGTRPESIAAAARAVSSGALLGLPTETVYGLAADASSDAAVAQIFAAKGRPSDHPLIVHVADASGIAHFASGVPGFAQKLVDAFWPGPLTLILPRLPGVATAATGGQDSVGLRCPAHPVAHALLLACAAPGDAATHGGPPVWGVAAPSANRFGRVSPTTARHVQDELGADLLVLDGGPCDVGIESTIVDCTRGVPVLLRPGAITRAQIAAACGIAPLSRQELPTLTPRASGTLEAHYAPAAKVRMMDAKALQTALDLLGTDAAHIAVYARSALRTRSSNLIMRRMPDDATATAQQLFAVLRSFDDQAVKLIWIETPPATPEWEGVRDRLQRAAAA